MRKLIDIPEVYIKQCKKNALNKDVSVKRYIENLVIADCKNKKNQKK